MNTSQRFFLKQMMFSSFCFMLLCLAGWKTLGDDLVACWRINEGTGNTINDSSGNGNNGIISGAAWTNGRTGGVALKFNGVDDCVEVPDNASLDITDEITITAWVKPAAIDNWSGIVRKRNVTSSPPYALELRRGYGFGVYFSSNNRDKDSLWWGRNPSLNEWYFVVAKFDGEKIYLYVNGVCKSKKWEYGALATNSDPLYIGRRHLYGFNGVIDEVKIYSRALTDDEIIQLYNED